MINPLLSSQVQEIDLWSKKGLKYSIEHAQAKMAMLGGEATREEEERQVPFFVPYDVHHLMRDKFGIWDDFKWTSTDLPQ